MDLIFDFDSGKECLERDLLDHFLGILFSDFLLTWSFYRCSFMIFHMFVIPGKLDKEGILKKNVSPNKSTFLFLRPTTACIFRVD